MEKKTCKNVQCLLISKLYPDFWYNWPILIQHHATNTFGKNNLKWKLQVIERWLIVQVCRWGDVNALVQSKFCSIIHQLSQHLLVNVTSRRCEISWKLTIKTPEKSHWGCSGVLTVKFKHVLHFVLLWFLLLTSNR